jgi:hypothetical protein
LTFHGVVCQCCKRLADFWPKSVPRNSKRLKGDIA